MFISDGNSIKKFTLYPLAKKITKIGDEEWMDDDNEIQPLFTISHISEEIRILNSIENFETSSQSEDDYSFQEQCNIENLSSRQMS